MQPTIILAEDDADLRQVMTEFLTDLGCCVLPASNGLAALRLFHHARGPRILLLDISMPVMDGLEVLEQLARGPELPGTRIVVLTAGNTDLHAFTGVTVLKKPAHPDLLLRALGIEDRRQQLA